MAGIKMKRWISAVVCAVMLYGLIAGAFAPQAEAATARIAKIISVTGDVQITKSGGKKPYKAFQGLYLNQGDHIATGPKSSLVLEVEDRKDEVTVGANSELYVSQLKEDDGSKNTSFKVWSGSVWTKASSLVDTEDTFEVETPTAVMGVRGTNFAITVQPTFGDTSVFVASGVVRAVLGTPNTPPNPSGSPNGNVPTPPTAPVLVYPSMQSNIYLDSGTGNVDHHTGYVDPESIVELVDPSIIEAIIRNSGEADKENDEFIEELPKQPELVPPGLDVNQDDHLDIYRDNLDNLIDNIVKQAVDNGKMNEQDVQNIIDQVNQETNTQLDINYKNPPEPKLTDEQKAMQERMKQLERQRRQQQEQQEQQREKQREQFSNVLNQIQQAMNQLNQQNQEKANQKREDAVERYKNQLTEEERRRFEERRNNLESNERAPQQTPPSGGSGGSGSPNRPTGSELNGTGTYTGSVTATVRSGSVTYGPESGTRTIDGNVTLNGGTSGDITLRNLVVAGDLTVNAGLATVILQNTVTVEGDTIIQDVSTQTFKSQAMHGGRLEIQDNNGTSLELGGSASDSLVEITGDGEVALRGEYRHLVQVKGAAQLVIEPGTKVRKLEIQHSDAQLVNEGHIDEIVVSPNVEPHESVQQQLEAIEARNIAAVNAAETTEQMRAALQTLGYLQIPDVAVDYLISLRPEAGFSGLEQIAAAVEQALAYAEADPYVAYHGPSPVLDTSTIEVEVGGADQLYAVDIHALMDSPASNLNPTADKLEQLAAAGDAWKFEVTPGQPSMELDLTPLTESGYYQWKLLLYAVKGDQVSKPTRSIMVPSEEMMIGTITGTVTLSEPAPEGGLRVMVFGKYYEYYQPLPILDEANELDLENYTFVNFEEGQTSAEYQLQVDLYGHYAVGYAIVSDLPAGSTLLKQGYAGYEDTMVSYLRDAQSVGLIEGNGQQVNLEIGSGTPVTGTVQMHESKLGGTDTVYVLIENGQGLAGFEMVHILGASPEPFTVNVPEGESYRVHYFLVEDYVFDNTYYYAGDGAYTQQPDEAAWIGMGTNLSLMLPADGIANVEIFDISKSGFTLRWEPVAGAYKYEFELYDDSMAYSIHPNMMSAQDAEAMNHTVHIDQIMSEFENGLAPNRTYNVVVNAVDQEYNRIAQGIGRFNTEAELLDKPYVVASTPIESAYGVPTNPKFTLTFSEPVVVNDASNGFVVLGGDYMEPIESIGVHAQVLGDGTIVEVSLDQALELDSYYTLEVSPGAVRSNNGLSNKVYSLPFHTTVTNLNVPSVTAVVYENSIDINWAPVIQASHYEIWVSGDLIESGFQDNKIEFIGPYAADELAILVRAYTGQSVIAETEIYPVFQPVPYSNAVAGFYDGLILYFDFEAVAGAASYVVYNDGSMVGHESEPGNVQVNWPGKVIIAALDENGRVIAKSEVRYIIDMIYY